MVRTIDSLTNGWRKSQLVIESKIKLIKKNSIRVGVSST